ncbi:hypothetical protein CASFOL_022760 [Castilleja foliolosa]|uniref:Uncharacterized protein n=1 Tax=Castilleja foliolosa TaxID=1961234 RepID=A0ABD3CTA7_9LAMI
MVVLTKVIRSCVLAREHDEYQSNEIAVEFCWRLRKKVSVFVVILGRQEVEVNLNF